MVVDLLFPVHGQFLPLDHAFGLYAALSHVLGDQIHERGDVGVFPVRGTRMSRQALALDGRSALRLRVPDQRIKDMLPLAGKRMEVDGHPVQVGVPRVMTLIPTATLAAGLVTIKLSRGGAGKPPPQVTPEAFLTAARKQLATLEVVAELAIPVHTTGPRAGEPKRRVLRVKDDTVVGFPLLVAGLSAADSLRLQEKGLGGRRVLGCGLFVAAKRGA